MNFRRFTNFLGLAPEKKILAESIRFPWDSLLVWGCDIHSLVWWHSWQRLTKSAAVPNFFHTVTSQALSPHTTQRAMRQPPNTMYLALSSSGLSFLELQRYELNMEFCIKVSFQKCQYMPPHFPWPVPIPNNMSYHKIAWKLEAAWLLVLIITPLCKWTGSSAALVLGCLSSFRAIGQF